MYSYVDTLCVSGYGAQPLDLPTHRFVSTLLPQARQDHLPPARHRRGRHPRPRARRRGDSLNFNPPLLIGNHYYHRSRADVMLKTVMVSGKWRSDLGSLCKHVFRSEQLESCTGRLGTLWSVTVVSLETSACTSGRRLFQVPAFNDHLLKERMLLKAAARKPLNLRIRHLHSPASVAVLRLCTTIYADQALTGLCCWWMSVSQQLCAALRLLCQVQGILGPRTALCDSHGMEQPSSSFCKTF